MSDMLEGLTSGFESIGKEWKREKRRADREDRVSRRALGRMRATDSRTTIREVAFDVMEAAYEKASGGGRYPANARQIYYAARPAILARADAESVDSQYFTQTLLKDYVEWKELEGVGPAWDVVYDARGHLTEPHTERGAVGLGGLGVREYQRSFTNGEVEEAPRFLCPVLVGTQGPALRYAGVLFIEKEGFDPILRAAKIAERFDLAVASTKGMPVSAVCDLLGAMNLPVYVVRDFDKAGFSIVAALRKGTRGSRGAPAKVIDLGLRLDDIEGLEREPVSYSGRSPERNLRRNGATAEEIEVLVGVVEGWGERVELNAMASDELVSWLERKLTEHGAGKVVPQAGALDSAYRRAVFLQEMRRRESELTEAYDGDAVGVPGDLRDQIETRLAAEPALAWDGAVWAVAEDMREEENADGGGDDEGATT